MKSKEMKAKVERCHNEERCSKNKMDNDKTETEEDIVRTRVIHKPNILML